MPQSRKNNPVVSALLLGLFAILPGSAQAALPPVIDAKPLFGDKLVGGRWQPIVVTIKNPDDGEALTGEVTTSLQDPATFETFSASVTPVALPRGAGTVQTTATVFVPEREQPDIVVMLRKGRDGRGDLAARRTFDQQRFADPSLTLLAVTALPDALSYLRGEKLGVSNTAGVLRPATETYPAKRRSRSFNPQVTSSPPEIRVENLSEAGQLPGTAGGYDTIGIVYLGPDIGPSRFSDAQVSALRGWVTGGGLLVVNSPGLRSDERFRTWLPVNASNKVAGRTVLGRGMVASIRGDLTEAGFARSAAALDLWRSLAHEACAEPLAGNLVQGRGLSYYPQMEFWQSVIRAPGLKAPPSSAIALFLLAYLMLLVPVNYFLLKRLDRREWTWATVPILVALFSVGACIFGYAIKGTHMLQNTVTLCEMGVNRGDTVVTAAIGIFSPRQRAYDLSTPLQDAAFWSPEVLGHYSRNSQEYSPLEVTTPGEIRGDSAVHIRNADISMWSMRSFGARTYQVQMGNGIAAELVQDGRELTGTVTNNTMRTLEQASLRFGGSRAELGALAPGEQKTVRMNLPKRGRTAALPRSVPPATDASRSELLEFQRPVMASIDSAKEAFYQAEQNERRGNDGRNTAFLYAWNQEEIFPVKVDGQPVPTGTNLNLIAVVIPVASR